MTGDELVALIRSQGAAKYKPWTDDPSWPYFAVANDAAALINLGKYTEAQFFDALWKQLDLFLGNAYGAFVMTHDNGQCVLRYLRFGDPALIHPEPPDNRFAPQDNGLQLSFVERGLNPYGEVMDDFHLQEGTTKWAQFASSPPFNAYGVFPETAKWLLKMDLFAGSLNDKYAWEPYRGLTIVQTMQLLRLGYPA